MLLNKVVFQDQGFLLCMGYNKFHLVDFGSEERDHGARIGPVQVGANTASQLLCLSHIDYLTAAVFHEVDAGTSWCIFDVFLPVASHLIRWNVLSAGGLCH